MTTSEYMSIGDQSSCAVVHPLVIQSDLKWEFSGQSVPATNNPRRHALMNESRAAHWNLPRRNGTELSIGCFFEKVGKLESRKKLRNRTCVDLCEESLYDAGQRRAQMEDYR